MDAKLKVRVRHYFRKSFGPHWTVATAFIGLWVALHPANWGSPLYSHAEIGFEDRNGNFKLFSAAPDHTISGEPEVRTAREDEIIVHPEDWDIYEESVDAQDALQMELRAARHLGRKYDWTGIIGFLPFGWNLEDPEKNYCSELCHIVRFDKRKRISPTLWGKVVRKIAGIRKVCIVKDRGYYYE